ncbi:hypothetical protein [Helicobacter sp. MIT 14-3879]|uniref:hypothetical protein n=1 Tax=Helicobacter sp. MIT 14-3879 TaxID=2040649 RepID=UPI000E1F2C62|nr:hypothetical protein [Helicobacter sp. MIT 14-3879]RDU65506.1 hypothetical protein CQA44_00490 [Helicobacter sp. MIT 14-3879]
MSFLSRLYQKVIISIDIDIQTCKVRTTYQNTNQASEEKTYKTINNDLPIEAAKYIRYIQNKYPFTYIATIARVKRQGIVNGNKLSSFEKFSLTPHLLIIMLISKKWFVYIDKEDMAKYKSKFSKVKGVDFIFSPFCFIYEKVKNRLDTAKKLYILQNNSSCTLLIADINGVYFGNYIMFEKESLNIQDNIEEKSDGIVEFEEINDIDENIIIKEFDNKQDTNTSSLNDLNIANTMIDIIKDTLNSFYKDDKYASDFIEELLILDACGISDNSITYLTNNIMLDTQFLRINICDEIEKLVKMELRL